jgi:hypothetical protein
MPDDSKAAAASKLKIDDRDIRQIPFQAESSVGLVVGLGQQENIRNAANEDAQPISQDQGIFDQEYRQHRHLALYIDCMLARQWLQRQQWTTQFSVRRR